MSASEVGRRDGPSVDVMDIQDELNNRAPGPGCDITIL